MRKFEGLLCKTESFTRAAGAVAPVHRSVDRGREAVPRCRRGPRRRPGGKPAGGPRSLGGTGRGRRGVLHCRLNRAKGATTSAGGGVEAEQGGGHGASPRNRQRGLGRWRRSKRVAWWSSTWARTRRGDFAARHRRAAGGVPWGCAAAGCTAAEGAWASGREARGQRRRAPCGVGCAGEGLGCADD